MFIIYFDFIHGIVKLCVATFYVEEGVVKLDSLVGQVNVCNWHQSICNCCGDLYYEGFDAKLLGYL